MKIAIPIESKSEDAKISQLFARSSYFAILDKVTGNKEIIDNPYCNDSMRIAANVIWMLAQKNVEIFAGYEFGLKMQNETYARKINLVLISDKYHNLKELTSIIKVIQKDL